ncbi:hypothetical protein G3I25_06645 [Streptomyces rochei]|nr:hypothetical protein [Streptomyces rochei]
MTSMVLSHLDNYSGTQCGAGPLEPACLPDCAAVEMVLTALRAWSPYDGDTWLDDVADALDPVPRTGERADELAERLRGYLRQLISYAASSEAKRDERVTPLLVRAREVHGEEPADDYWRAVGQLRRLGWAVNELHDALVELHAVKGPDSLREDQWSTPGQGTS